MNLFIFTFILLPLIFIADRLRIRKFTYLFTVDGINVYLDNNNDVNAYVIGKNIVLTKGLLSLSREDIRAILAHELSHIVLNHYKRSFIVALLGLSISLILVNFNIFYSLATLILTFLLQRIISRKDEIEADKLAYSVVGDSLKRVLEKYGGNHHDLVSTHPSTEKRLKALNYIKSL